MALGSFQLSELSARGVAGGGRAGGLGSLFLAVQRCTSCLPAGVSGCLNLLRTQWSVCFTIISIQIFTLYTGNVPRLTAEVAPTLTVMGRMGSGITAMGM